jgi:hypothetical protein
MPTCCTQDTVHLGMQNFSVEYSDGVFLANIAPAESRDTRAAASTSGL